MICRRCLKNSASRYGLFTAVGVALLYCYVSSYVRYQQNLQPDNTWISQERDTELFLLQAKSRARVMGKLQIDPKEELQRRYDVEYDGQRRRLPSAIIIGASKCGTEALEFFLEMHPDIATDRSEINFFSYDGMYKLGYSWFRNQMPTSSRGQITLQRGTGYFDTPGVPERIRSMNASIKLILCTCNPVRRVQSWYTHVLTHGRIEGHDVATFKEMFFYPRNGSLKWRQRVVYSSNYALLLTEWLKWFQRNQIHIVIGDYIKMNPLTEIRKIEDFLGLGHKIGESNLVYNEQKRFYCRIVDGNEECLGPNKGRVQVDIDDSFIQILNDHFASTNKKFFEMIGEKLDWRYVKTSPNTTKT